MLPNSGGYRRLEKGLSLKPCFRLHRWYGGSVMEETSFLFSHPTCSFNLGAQVDTMISFKLKCGVKKTNKQNKLQTNLWFRSKSFCFALTVPEQCPVLRNPR